MIDIHSHMLPGLDNGPQTMDDTLAMAKTAVSQGIDTVIVTPHHQNGRYHNQREAIIGVTDYVNAKLQETGIALNILPGQEIRVHETITNGLQDGSLLPLNQTTRYVLLELPEDTLPSYLAQLLFDMQIAGYVPVIAHPERHSIIAENPNHLYDMVKNGVLVQADAASLVGIHGKRVQKLTRKLLQASMVHFMATNTHSADSEEFRLAKAYQSMKQSAKFKLQENAELLIDGQPIQPDVPTRIKLKRNWNPLKRN
ncbi:tyrosine protein phosphatase [Barrientosiimonas marina]|uniref:Tyrosine-protein phosphatase n=1 Tax=Lentibacillus kimchii TaxID=1542911 RepID=A0ABW2UX28_9BACI